MKPWRANGPGNERRRLLAGLLVALLVVGLAGAGLVYHTRSDGSRPGPAVPGTPRALEGSPAGVGDEDGGAGGVPPALEFTGSELVGWFRGQKQWALKARSVEVVDESERSRLTGIQEGVIYREGKPYLGFSSAKGEWNPATGSLELSGGIQVTLEGRPVFRTELLRWDGAREKLIIPGRVELSWEGRELSADYLEGDLKRQTLVATGNVRLQDSGQSLEAQRVTIDLASGQVRAEGTARLVVNVP